jgi:hypothetical protein
MGYSLVVTVHVHAPVALCFLRLVVLLHRERREKARSKRLAQERKEEAVMRLERTAQREKARERCARCRVDLTPRIVVFNGLSLFVCRERKQRVKEKKARKKAEREEHEAAAAAQGGSSSNKKPAWANARKFGGK